MSQVASPKALSLFAHHGELLRSETRHIPGTRPAQFLAVFYYQEAVRTLAGEVNSWKVYTPEQWAAMPKGEVIPQQPQA